MKKIQMKPSIIKVNDPMLDWCPGNKHPEREVLLYTLEEAVKLPGYNWFVELGTFRGINARNFINTLNKLNHNCRFASVDFNPFNKRHHFYPKIEWETRCKNIIGPCIQYFFEGKTVDHANGFDNESIAWLFIDACHCFECVRDEIKLYTPKLTAGGYMLFHDTSKEQNDQWVTHDPPRRYGVIKAINQSQELKTKFKFIGEVKTNHGIQVWKKVQGISNK